MYRMYAPFKSNNISIHSVGAVECSSKKVLLLHILPLGVHTALWSGLSVREEINAYILAFLPPPPPPLN